MLLRGDGRSLFPGSRVTVFAERGGLAASVRGYDLEKQRWVCELVDSRSSSATPPRTVLVRGDELRFESIDFCDAPVGMSRTTHEG